MPELNRLEEITDSLKQYLNTNLEIVKLEVIERSSTFGSSMVGILVVGISVFLFVFSTPNIIIEVRTIFTINNTRIATEMRFFFMIVTPF